MKFTNGKKELSLGLSDQIWRRLRIVRDVVSLQVVIQCVNMIVGFLLMRMLPQHEFAWFVIMASMMAMVTILSDCGCGVGVLSIGGRVHQKAEELSRLVKTAFQIRVFIFLMAICILAPFTFFLLHKNEASTALSLLLIVIGVIGAIASTANSILSVPARLKGHYTRVQICEFYGTLTRGVISIITVLIYPVAILAVIGTTLGVWVHNRFLYKFSRDLFDFNSGASVEYRKEMLSIVKKLWFPSVFAAFQPQVAVLVLSLLGNTEDVAGFGALVRFGALLALTNALILSVLSPTFARCHDYKDLVRKLLQAMSLLMFLSISIVVFSWLFPEPFAWILGPKYQDLAPLIWLFFISSAFAAFRTLLWSFDSARGWVDFNWLIPPATIAVLFITPLFVDISTVSGALWLTLLSYVPAVAILFARAFRGLRKMRYN